jgi:hypothetical protein
MMVPPVGERTDNLQFAFRTVSFLAHEDDGMGGSRKRTRCVFVENGRLVSDFSSLEKHLRPPPPPLKIPSLWQLQEKLVDAGNQIIDKFQENGGPSSLVLGRDGPRQDRRLRDILRALLVVASILAVWFVVRRVWGARQPTDVAPPPPGGQQPRDPEDGPPPGAFRRRQRELARRNNLYEPVRMALREFFAGVGAPAEAGPKLPKVVIADSVRRPDTLKKALTDLWRIAYGLPAVVTVPKWNLLELLFDRIQMAHADGKWRFVVDVESLDAGRGSEA